MNEPSLAAVVALCLSIITGWVAWVFEGEFPSGFKELTAGLTFAGILAGMPPWEPLQLVLWATAPLVGLILAGKALFSRFRRGIGSAPHDGRGPGGTVPGR